MAKKKKKVTTQAKAKKKKPARKGHGARRAAKKVDPPAPFAVDLSDTNDASLIDSTSQGHHGNHHSTVISSIRNTTHVGCNVSIKTSYEITVNDQPFGGHVTLGQDGRLATHACPYQDFGSAIEMMKHLVEVYPEFYDPCGREADRPAVSHHQKGHVK